MKKARKQSPDKKKCKCGYTGYFITKECGKCRSKKNKPVQVFVKKPKRKKTGELELFKEIWNERPHRSEIDGTPLGEFNVAYFSHILNKKQYPKFRLRKDNIVLKTFKQHQQWELQRNILRGVDIWAWVFRLQDKLKQEDQQRNKIIRHV